MKLQQTSASWQKKLALLGAPLALVAAIASPQADKMLTRWEGNILYVYKDKLASNIPTFCAGRTDWSAKPGTKLSSDDCREINKVTLLEYGYHMLTCTTWSNLTPARIVALTVFAINVGKAGACGSEAVKAINRGQIEAGCRLIAWTPAGRPNWSYVDGKFVQGLSNRRQAEYSLCLLDQLPLQF